MLQQSNASRPVTMMEQRGNGNGNSVPSFWNPSLPDPLSYQSPRQTPHSTIQVLLLVPPYARPIAA